jgi:amino acid adenylation domain-containing protein
MTTAQPVTGAAPLPVRAPSSAYPLSPAQRRMWFLDQLEPGSPQYNVVIAHNVTGPLDVGRLERALRAMTGRHEILRSALVNVEDEPGQLVEPSVDVAVALVDVSGEPEPAVAAARIVDAAAAAPFDLGSAPLLRASFIRRAADDGVLLLVTHQAVVDGASSAALLDELAAHYEAGGDAQLPEAQLQYGDVSAWLGRLVDSDWAAEERAHWQAALVGVPSVLQLPGDRPRPARQSYTGAHTARLLPAQLMDRLASTALAEDTPPFTAMLAALAGLLARYSGQDDIVIGTTAPARQVPGLKAVVGPLANTIPLRVDASDDPSFRTLLSRSRATAEAAFAHADLPFDVLVDQLAPDRDTSRNPLFQVVLLDGPPAHDRRLGEAVLSPFVPGRGTSRFDLTVSCADVAGGLAVDVEYAKDLFDGATIDDMLVRLERLLDAALTDPDLPLSRLALLSPHEQDEAVAGSRGPVVPSPTACLHHTFAARVAERPGAPAVSGGGRTLTYAELSVRANQLANALYDDGVRPGDLVALALPRDPDLLAAIIAVHRCGAAYLPLEPSYPSERLEFMVADAGVRLLVTTSALTGVVPAFDGTRLLLDDPSTLAGRPETDPGVAVSPEDLAYVIYTSGSTGLPKGVLVQHGAVVNLMAEMAQRPGLAAGEVMVGVTTPAFDLSVPDLFLPLLTGAHLVLADPIVAADPSALARLLDDVGADVMQATPSTWRMLLDDGWPGRPGMRIVCGGEGYTSALARPLAGRVAQLWNFYGPTEATVWCTSALLADPTDPLPLGKPLPGYFVYVADGAGAPVPHGVAGELVVGGVGLARGYHARPELTEDRFITVDGRRTYRTGDLARTRRDGTLEFLGRIDHQVKLRGFRIELGEIESALAAHAAVRDVVVVVREDAPGDQRLVGYVVGDVDGSELRTFIGTRLPSYMVPSVVMVLDDLPRTPNGKTDRKRLPLPDVAQAGDAGYVAPRGPVEEAVAEMWCEVLRLDRVGVLDDFFTVGGHSLRITQILSRVREAFGVDLSLREVYERPTIEAIAQAITIRLLDDPDLAELMAEIEGADGLDA